jgi:hypothetical protein
MKDTAPALALLALGTAALAAAALVPRGGPVLAVFAPGTPREQAFAAVVEAGWLPVSAPRDFLVVAAPAAEAPVPTLPAGALLMIDARGARGCKDDRKT